MAAIQQLAANIQYLFAGDLKGEIFEEKSFGASRCSIIFALPARKLSYARGLLTNGEREKKLKKLFKLVSKSFIKLIIQINDMALSKNNINIYISMQEDAFKQS